MKYLLILSVIISIYGCGDPYPTKEIVLGKDTSEHSIDFNRFMICSKRFNEYSLKSLQCLIKGMSDSAAYYKGKSQAYYEMEEVLYP